MSKTKVSDFEDLVVILMKAGQVKTVHGSINASQPGVWQTRESANIVIVDLSVKTAFNWQDDIVDGAGRSLREYRRDLYVWECQQLEEPESRQLMGESPLSILPIVKAELARLDAQKSL